MSRPRGPESEIKSGNYLARRLVEETLGRALPPRAIVHHADENPMNNTRSNLVVCSSEAYHNLLHMRADAYDACGNANYKRCYICKGYDEPSNLAPLRKPGRNITTFYHPVCQRGYKAKRKALRSLA